MISLVSAAFVIALLVGVSIAGYLIYNKDDDGDGIRNAEDAFPNDPAASLDSDGDGYPDEWNAGKSQSDSTTGLRLDAFPMDPAASLDSDGDGYPDKWNAGKSQSDSTTGLKLDMFPFDPDFQTFNDLGLEFVSISSGSFMMGSTEGHSDEGPVHEVIIGYSFQMGKFEVTQAQWEAVMGSNPSSFSGDSNPVDSVSWNDCQSFISKLNSLDPDHTYRLPTEAEWEYCCRAGSDADYCFGNERGTLGDYAWYSANSNDRTHPVGQKLPNAWGLYDMHGNVWEWCEDWYHGSYYGAPDDGTAWDDEGSDRVERGGGFYSNALNCRSANRDGNNPNDCNHSIGLRFVRVEA